MDYIPYINDLEIEIKILHEIKNGGNCNVDEINKIIIEKEKILENCKINLNKLSNNKIYCRIYLKLLNGLNPSKALEEIAEENYQNGIKPSSVSTLWVYYKKLKKILKS